MDTSSAASEVKEPPTFVDLDAGDVRLRVWTHTPTGGEATERPVVFLHGFPDDHRTWSRQWPAFADRPIAMPDLRGVGGSTAPDNRRHYDRERLLADLRAVIEHIAGPDGQVDLVGHDWGTLIGWWAASDPETAARLRSFVAISCPHPDAMLPHAAALVRRPGLRNLGTLFDQLRRSWYVFWFQLPWLPELSFRWGKGSFHRTLHVAELDEDDEMFALTHDEAVALMHNSVNMYRCLFRRVLRHRELPDVRVPTRVIAGDRDLALSPRVYDNLAEFAPDVSVTFLPANHWVHRTHPEEVNGLIREWIQ